MKSSKILFFDDYSEGAHPQILKALLEDSLAQERGYGQDGHSVKAEQLIQQLIHQNHAKIHFVSSGTQANLVCLAALLKTFESVIAASNGHINVHEAGAIEATGHKINIAASSNGKLTVAGIEEVLEYHNDSQMVKPKVVYISQSTELGTIYSKQEFIQISETCRKRQLYLYVDGARLGNALTADQADVSLSDIARWCDIFYIGGTKNGALLGEAIVIVNPDLQADFGYHLRQRGALLAKARSVSLQFFEFFKDNLYFDNARHANQMAQKLAQGIQNCGFEFFHPPVTNQIFPILPQKMITHLEQKYGFYIWCKAPKPEHSVIRLVTSWATSEETVTQFLSNLINHSMSR